MDARDIAEIADKIRRDIGVNHSAITAAVKAGLLEGEQRGREQAAVIAKTGWLECGLDVIMDADAAQQLCERIEQAIRNAKEV